MYSIPESFDISALESEAIGQIAFGLNSITLFFDKGFIQFSGSFSFNSGEKYDSYAEVYPVENDFGILQLLEKQISVVSLNDNRDELLMKFEGGYSLCLIGHAMYESFILRICGEEIRV